MKASIHGGEGDGGGKRIKSVLNLMATNIFFGSLRLKAKTLLEILGTEPLATSNKPKTITLNCGGSMPRLFLKFDSKALWVLNISICKLDEYCKYIISNIRNKVKRNLSKVLLICASFSPMHLYLNNI